jgi:hypothetical protein
MVRAGLAMMVVALAAPAFAADKPPPDLVAARAAFAAAVAKNDMAATAALTSFPLKNVVYRGPKTVPEAKFGAQFKMYRQLGECLKSGPLQPTPVKGGAPVVWTIDCDGNEISFALKDGRWLHSGYENINE